MSTPADRPRPGRGARLRAWAFSPVPAEGRAREWGRSCVRIMLIMYEEYFRTHITIRASALTFAIILSIVPLLALSTSILKGLGTDAQLRQAAVRAIEQLVPAAPVQDGNSPAPTAGIPADASFSTHLYHAVDLVFDYVDRTNFAALGLVGVIGLIAVVLLVLSSIEDAMNAIWHTRRGRSFFRKVMDYLALLILLPLSINIALAAEAIVASRQIMEHLGLILPSAWLATLLIKLIPFVFVVLTLMFLYVFFPHVKVQTRAAFAGALFAAVFWFIVQKIYIVLQIGVANYNAIYGSFASIPLMLIWLHIGWTFILLGAMLAHAVQHHRHYRGPSPPQSPQRRLQTAIDIVLAVYEDFALRRPTLLARLAERLPYTRPADVEAVARLLTQEGALGWSEDDGEETLVPVTPAENLPGGEISRLVLGDAPLPTRGGQLAAAAIAAASRILDARLDLARPMLRLQGEPAAEASEPSKADLPSEQSSH
ncbi:MAG: YihY/virulence factor BrkB family protein [Desulfobulbus sp.]|jgi:membrane protein|nr:YihY/virulence factor BrkB family protein [Desulfobulbus sp.]